MLSMKFHWLDIDPTAPLLRNIFRSPGRWYASCQGRKAVPFPLLCDAYEAHQRPEQQDVLKVQQCHFVAVTSSCLAGRRALNRREIMPGPEM